MCDPQSLNVTPFRQPDRAASQLPSDLCEQIEAYAQTHHIGLSEALGYLIKAGLAAEARAMLESETAQFEPWCPALAI